MSAARSNILSFDGSKLQPKFKECAFDSDKNPKAFLSWTQLLAGLVRNIPGGEALEDFLDEYLDRKKIKATMPAFLQDDRLSLHGLGLGGSSPRPRGEALGSRDTISPRINPIRRRGGALRTILEEDDDDSSERTASVDRGGASGTTSSARSEPDDELEYEEDHLPEPGRLSCYADLPQESQKLDQILFHTLYTIVSGSFLSIITDLQGGYARYTFAMIAMWKHSELGAATRRLEALNSMQDLSYQGDPGKWKLQLMAKAREVYASGLTIEHYIMHCAFKSFAGKNTQVQGMIAEDINSEKVGPDMPLEELATRYSVFLSTLQAGNKGVNSIAPSNKCSYCDKPGHSAKDCRKRLSDEADKKKKKKGAKTSSASTTFTGKCNHCGKQGHKAVDCRKKAAEDKDKQQGDKPKSGNDSQKQASVNATQNSRMTPAQLEDLVSQLKAGALSLFHVTTESLRTNSSAMTAVVDEQGPSRQVSEADLGSDPSVPDQATQEKIMPTMVNDLGTHDSACDGSFLDDLYQELLSDMVACAAASPRHKGVEPSLEPTMVNMVKVTNSTDKKGVILSCCDGMSCASLSLEAVGIRHLYDVIALEVNPDARMVAQRADANITHGIRGCHDIFQITEEDIKTYHKDSIKLLSCGPECTDFSKLRLLRDRPGYKGSSSKEGKDPRKGLNGKTGKTFRQCIVIWNWVQKHHPNAKYFFENVEFKDMPEHWHEVCSALGKPYVVNHRDHSTTKRRRAYWTNLDLPPDWKEGYGPIDPNTCMDPGRKVQRYMAEGRLCTRPLGAKWMETNGIIVQDTSKPLLVDDETEDEPQFIRPHEAEKLHGIKPGTTAGPGITDVMRLQCIGAGWDINVTKMFFKHLKTTDLSPADQVAASVRVHLASLQENFSEEDYRKAIVLTTIKDRDPKDYWNMVLRHMEKDPEHAAKMIALQVHYSDLMQLSNRETSSILDSGAAVHLDGRTRITDPDRRERIHAWTGDSSWTNGQGYLPMQLYDEDSGKHFDIDLDEFHSITGNEIQIISMGKLIRKGWFFSLGMDEMYGLTPDGRKVRVTLGTDDILRLPHDLREGDDAEPLPVNVVSQTREGVTYDYLHRLFNHASADKIHRTLGATTGIQQPKQCVKGCYCESCAQGNARSKGLRQTTYSAFTNQVFMATLGSDSSDDTNETWSDEDLGYDDSDTEHVSQVSESNHLIASTGVAIQSEQEGDTDYFLDEPEPVEIPQFKAEKLGRSAEGAPPRFDVASLKPFQVMMADEKAYDHPQRGDKHTSFVLVDIHSNARFKEDASSKKDFPRCITKIIVENGIHLLPYDRTLYTDGCGSMVNVKNTVLQMGINHIFIPPHSQSLNEAEKICDRTWAAARVYLCGTGAQPQHMSLAVDYVLYMHNRMANGSHREYKTPYELIRSQKPSIAHCRPFFTLTHVTVPKAKRAQMKKNGLPFHRAETGRLVGYQDMWSTTPKILLPENRIVHSRNCTYDIYDDGSDRRHPELTAEAVDTRLTAIDEQLIRLLLNGSFDKPDPVPALKWIDNPIQNQDSQDEDLSRDALDFNLDESSAPEGDVVDLKRESSDPSLSDFPDVFVNIDPLDMSTPPTGKGCRTKYPVQRYIPGTTEMETDPRKVYLATMDTIAKIDEHLYVYNAQIEKAMARLRDLSNELDCMGPIIASVELAQTAMKDMKWNEALQSEHREPALKALDDELKSLEKRILTPILPGNPKFSRAVKEATPGRLLLDIKRSGKYKVRGVKQGFRENKEIADGYDFSYYSNVVKLHAVRLTLMRRRKPGGTIGYKDVSTAFLQTNSYPNGMTKFVCFKHPVTKQWMYYEQSGPIYGEASAPVRWEDTIAPWIEEQGFIRGSNEPSVFYHPDRDLVILLYVDDIMVDGQDDDCKWIFGLLSERFDCTDAVWLLEGEIVDYLGIEVTLIQGVTYMCMSTYIEKCCEHLQIDGKSSPVPITAPIETDSPLLDGAGIKQFLTANGMLGWLAQTVRLDVSYAYSRIAQHCAKPTEAALKAVRKVFAYLKATKDLSIASCNVDSSRTIDEVIVQANPEYQNVFRFFSDSDHAGNSEEQNKRRSQNGALSTVDGAPWWWLSKASSVCFACPEIGEAHADMSSGAVEIYAAGNACMDIMGLRYMIQEMGMDFPSPFILEMDNDAAKIFCQGNAQKTKLKHIDTRQHWVRCLRDKNLMKPAHVPTEDNLADIFTKILPTHIFLRLRDQLLKPRPCPK